MLTSDTAACSLMVHRLLCSILAGTTSSSSSSKINQCSDGCSGQHLPDFSRALFFGLHDRRHSFSKPRSSMSTNLTITEMFQRFVCSHQSQLLPTRRVLPALCIRRQRASTTIGCQSFIVTRALPSRSFVYLPKSSFGLRVVIDQTFSGFIDKSRNRLDTPT